MTHKCNKEKDLTEMKDNIKFIKARLVGNGEKGLFRKFDEIQVLVNKFDNYNHFKNWILGSAITVMGVVIGFLVGYRFF